MPGVRPRAWWRPLAVALVAVAGGGACRQTLGLDAYSTATTDAGPSTDGGADATTSDSSADASACGLPYGGASCAACVQTSCCAESETCAKDAVCVQSQQCLGACGGDPACRAACPSPSGESAAALAACMASSCAQSCGLPCGGMAPAVSPAAMAPGCQSCFEKGPACSAAISCGTSSDCQAYVQCLRSCYTPDCREACAAAHDAGPALYAPVESTLAGACATACGYGQDWRCIGQVQWSAPAPGVTTTDLIFERVNGIVQRQPIPGALVSLCGAVGASCTSALVSGRTDDAGYLDLPVSTVASSIVPAGIEPLIEVTAPGYLPTYLSYFFPLTQRTLTFAPGVSPVLWPEAGAPPDLAMDGGPGNICIDGGPCLCPGGVCPVGPDAASPPSEIVAAVFDCQGHPAVGASATAVVEAPFSSAPIAAFSSQTGILILYATDMGPLDLLVWETPPQPAGKAGAGPPPGSVLMMDGGGPPPGDASGCSGGCFLPIGEDGGLVCAPGVCVGPAAEAGPPEAGPLPPPFGGPPTPSVPEGGVAIGHFFFTVVPGSTTMVWIVPQPGL